MVRVGRLPGPCLLCGSTLGRREPDGWLCAVCEWPYGDAPDPELPRPIVEVVYYLRWEDRIKIGTSRDPKGRLAAIRHQELLAFERGGRALEQARHREFADLRLGGEWFAADRVLLAHIAALNRGVADPWHQYARWISAAFRG
jgi:hypothetical protein